MGYTVKPSLRGVSHQWGAGFFALAGMILVSQAPSGKAAVAAGVYSLTLVALLVVSAFYHRPTWQPKTRVILRRLDHSAIFILIAGTYTPICLLVLGEGQGESLLRFVWVGAGIGVAQSVFWPKAPKSLVAVLCGALGWGVAWEWAMLSFLLNRQVLAMILLGGVLYTIGALIYVTRRPDPWPEVFGYHEIFHALVLVASMLHFTAVAQVVFEFG